MLATIARFYKPISTVKAFGFYLDSRFAAKDIADTRCPSLLFSGPMIARWALYRSQSLAKAPEQPVMASHGQSRPVIAVDRALQSSDHVLVRALFCSEH